MKKVSGYISDRKRCDMFSIKNLIVTLMTEVFFYFLLASIDTWLIFNGYQTNPDPASQFVQMLLVLAALFTIVMLAIGIVVNIGLGLGILPSWSKPKPANGYTKHELYEIDVEEEPHHNETTRQQCAWAGDGAVWYDYRGVIRSYPDDALVGYERSMDKRMVRNGEVCDLFVMLDDGLYYLKSELPTLENEVKSYLPDREEE